MLKNIKKGYYLGECFYNLLKKANNQINPLIFPYDSIGEEYNKIFEKISKKGLLYKLGFNIYFIFNPLTRNQKETDSRIIYLDLRKKGVIKDNQIKTIEDIL
ncbi:MAG TPA: hypothetical protein VJ912_03555 [Candidatus Nanoarchaeia archaeon]|nr:hypothetical protein [Candidatus Nanoarchaeia archaeon]